jgi:hypothetical protein
MLTRPQGARPRPGHSKPRPAAFNGSCGLHMGDQLSIGFSKKIFAVLHLLHRISKRYQYMHEIDVTILRRIPYLSLNNKNAADN